MFNPFQQQILQSLNLSEATVSPQLKNEPRLESLTAAIHFLDNNTDSSSSLLLVVRYIEALASLGRDLSNFINDKKVFGTKTIRCLCEANAMLKEQLSAVMMTETAESAFPPITHYLLKNSPELDKKVDSLYQLISPLMHSHNPKLAAFYEAFDIKELDNIPKESHKEYLKETVISHLNHFIKKNNDIMDMADQFKNELYKLNAVIFNHIKQQTSINTSLHQNNQNQHLSVAINRLSLSMDTRPCLSAETITNLTDIILHIQQLIEQHFLKTVRKLPFFTLNIDQASDGSPLEQIYHQYESFTTQLVEGHSLDNLGMQLASLYKTIFISTDLHSQTYGCIQGCTTFQSLILSLKQSLALGPKQYLSVESAKAITGFSMHKDALDDPNLPLADEILDYMMHDLKFFHTRPWVIALIGDDMEASITNKLYRCIGQANEADQASEPDTPTTQTLSRIPFNLSRFTKKTTGHSSINWVSPSRNFLTAENFASYSLREEEHHMNQGILPKEALWQYPQRHHHDRGIAPGIGCYNAADREDFIQHAKSFQASGLVLCALVNPQERVTKPLHTILFSFLIFSVNSRKELSPDELQVFIGEPYFNDQYLGDFINYHKDFVENFETILIQQRRQLAETNLTRFVNEHKTRTSTGSFSFLHDEFSEDRYSPSSYEKQLCAIIWLLFNTQRLPELFATLSIQESSTTDTMADETRPLEQDHLLFQSLESHPEDKKTNGHEHHKKNM